MKLRHTISITAVTGLTLLAASCSSDDDSVADGSIVTAAENSTATPDSTGTDPSTSEQDLDERRDDIRDALSNGDFTTMLDLLELSGLSDELEGREITVLAPSESAFSGLSADELSELITDPSSAEALLRRHIIDGLHTFDELAGLAEVTTISDETLPVTSTGDSVTVDGATVSPPDADALAGEEGQEVAVFGIDRLLLDDQ